MALVLKDRVKETTITTGTGNFQLQGPASGFRPFNDIGDGNFTYYAVITEAAIGEYEIGYGQFNLSTQQITRTTIISSSNSNNIVNFSVGVKEIFCTYPGLRSVFQQPSGIVDLPVGSTVNGSLLGGVGPTGPVGPTGAFGGPTGPTGIQGDKGGLRYTFSTTTVMADPGAGFLRFNNAAIASVTTIALSANTYEGANLLNYLLTWDDGQPTVKGQVIFKSNTDVDSTYAVFSLTSVVDQTSWVELVVTHLSGTLPTNLESLVTEFSRTGDIGPTGPTGPDGRQVARPAVFQWALTTPAISGASTYTWTGGTYAAPAGWNYVITTAPSEGYILYTATVTITDVFSAITTAFNWTGANIVTSGYAGTIGPTGPTGPTGPQGDKGGLRYNFSDTVVMADPGTGTVRFNNAAIGSVTSIAINDLAYGGTDISSYILSWDDGNPTTKGNIIFKSNVNSIATYAIFSLTSLTDNAGWIELTVTYVSGSIPSNTAELVVDFARTGNIGPTGPNIASSVQGGSGGTILFQSALDTTTTDTDFTFVAASNTLVVNSVDVGRGGVGDDTNTAIGKSALSINTATGYRNTAVGSLSLDANTTGTDNTVIGYNAGGAIIAGLNNSVLGSGAYPLGTGSNNVAIGPSTLSLLTGGDQNIAIGDSALFNILNGSNQNIAIGYLAGYDLAGNVDGNVLLGGFAGNAGGLDISGSSNTVTISNGAGTVRLHYTANGGFITKIHTASTTLWANNFLEVFATSNTSLTFRYRGSDGTTRSASITLS